MEKSEQINELAAALCKFQGEIKNLDLDREVEVSMKSGGKYKFKYATMANMVEKARPLLFSNGLSYVQPVNIDGSVTTMLLHSSGQFISSTLKITGDNTPQGIGSAITYAKRYSLCSMLGIVADDDDDANIAQGNTYKIGNEKPRQQNESKAAPPAATFPQLNPKHERWAGAVKSVAEGTTTLERIKQSFTLFEHNEKEFLKQVEAYKNQTV